MYIRFNFLKNPCLEVWYSLCKAGWAVWQTQEKETWKWRAGGIHFSPVWQGQSLTLGAHISSSSWVTFIIMRSSGHVLTQPSQFLLHTLRIRNTNRPVFPLCPVGSSCWSTLFYSSFCQFSRGLFPSFLKPRPNHWNPLMVKRRKVCIILS